MTRNVYVIMTCICVMTIQVTALYVIIFHVMTLCHAILYRDLLCYDISCHGFVDFEMP